MLHPSPPCRDMSPLTGFLQCAMSYTTSQTGLLILRPPPRISQMSIRFDLLPHLYWVVVCSVVNCHEYWSRLHSTTWISYYSTHHRYGILILDLFLFIVSSLKHKTTFTLCFLSLLVHVKININVFASTFKFTCTSRGRNNFESASLL